MTIIKYRRKSQRMSWIARNFEVTVAINGSGRTELASKAAIYDTYV